MGTKPDDADLANLSAEERESAAELDEEESKLPKTDAAASTEEAEAGTDAAAKAAAEKTTTDAAAVAAEAAAAKPTPEAEAKVTADEEAAAAEKAKAGEPEETEIVTAPKRSAIPDWKAPEDAETKLADIAKREADLAEKFDGGDISAKEHLEGLKALQKEERVILKAVDRAEMAADMRKAEDQALVDTWEKQTVPAFLKDHTQYKEGTPLFAMLDGELRRLQTETATAGGNPLSPELLGKAHESIVALVSGKPADDGATKAAAEAAAAAKAKEASPAKKAAERDKTPPTLGKVPASATTETGGPADALDALDNASLEQALAKMTPEQQDRFLATQN